jgi:hypothetical protein
MLLMEEGADDEVLLDEESEETCDEGLDEGEKVRQGDSEQEETGELGEDVEGEENEGSEEPGEEELADSKTAEVEDVEGEENEGSEEPGEEELADSKTAEVRAEEELKRAFEAFQAAEKKLRYAEKEYNKQLKKNSPARKKKDPEPVLTEEELAKQLTAKLITAVKAGTIKTVRSVLKEMEEKEVYGVSETDKWGNTALHYACRMHNSKKLVEVLLDADYEALNVQSGSNDDEPGWTPLMEAAAKDNWRCLKALLERNPSLYATEWYSGSNALDYAVLNKSKKCIILLRRAMGIPPDGGTMKRSGDDNGEDEDKLVEKDDEEESDTLETTCPSPQRYGRVAVRSATYAEWKAMSQRGGGKTQ